MDIELKIKWGFSNKQLQAIEYLSDNETTELFYGGGAGGGKSFLGCAWLIMNCIRYPGSRWLMGRAVLKSLKESTLLTFFEVCKKAGLKKGEHFNYNANDNVIRWENDSEIYLKDLFAYPSDPEFDSLGSTEYTGAFVDEISQITVKSKNIVMSRLRYKLEEFKITPKLLMASNPSKNFAYYEFYKPWKEKKLEPYRKFIPALVQDNPFISPFYIENLKKLDKVSKERLLYGNFEYDEDPSRLFEYEKVIDIFTNEAERGTTYLTIDVAGKGDDLTVLVFWDGLFITKILTQDNISNEELDKILIKNKIPRSRCIADEDGVGFGLVKDLSGIQGFVNNAQPIKKLKRQTNKPITHNYSNLKSQCWFELAHLVNSGLIGCYRKITTVNKELLIEDLEQIKQKDADKDTKLKVISKEEIKEHIGRSTDIGDAVMMRMFFELRPQVVTI